MHVLPFLFLALSCAEPDLTPDEQPLHGFTNFRVYDEDPEVSIWRTKLNGGSFEEVLRLPASETRSFCMTSKGELLVTPNSPHDWIVIRAAERSSGTNWYKLPYDTTEDHLPSCIRSRRSMH